ncbi:heme o synthase [Aquisalinus flavus]|uniref:Protoheme IX farnesyltransferase n=1 Tax=Aquisalinus flavus TaxID=1526572 RepID=A0A8J2Y5C5_9PROT|nr:heme o synthase [Aquisalinus flavus]MBD0426825.1 protoheme IX farnesyltransferase [Aquisalinus flavus]UNE46673.1 protoheme IX farnesyltransferase [Aquisalinus flavus]GGC96297.1 protoheme IX farnesyltransferase [Aquisalinus flavus]
MSNHSADPNSETLAFNLAQPGDYFALLKPRVMSLVIFTALVGMVAAPGPVANWPLALISLFAISVGAGASGALNMWWDSDIDAVMSRTKGRPIPSGKVQRADAFGFGLFLSVLAVIVLALAANYLAAGLLAFTIFFYAVIYSMFLKRSTPQNIVIGGAAGALPPVVGWAAVTGTAPLEAWLLFAIIFFWTPPHFWALSLFKSEDYAAAGIPMMPNVKGEARTKLEILVYTVIVAVIAVTPVFFAFAGWLYGTVAVVLGAIFLAGSIRLYVAKDEAATMRASKSLFGFSIFYLFLIYAALLAEHLLGLHG